MVVQLLAPGMEDRQKANVSAEMHGISRNGQQGVGHGLEEEGIQGTGVLEGEPMERVGQGKDNMEIGHLEELTLPGRQLGRLRRPLTRGTVPIAAGIVTDFCMAAVVTRHGVAPKERGPACPQRPEHAMLFCGHPVAIARQRGGPILLDDIGDFEPRAGHSKVSNTLAIS
jgi:hypothetical protein